MVDDINKAASSVSDVTQKALGAGEDASRQAADQARAGFERAADAAVQVQDGAKTAIADVQKTVSEAYGRSIQELQDLSQRALTIRSPKDLATWQLDLFQHFQNDARAAIDIYRASVTTTLRTILPASKQAPTFEGVGVA